MITLRESNGHDFTLAAHEVHLWVADLSLFALRAAEITRFLADEERVRASRYHFPADRERFGLTRGLLRKLLGRYVNCEPAEIEFTYGIFGKPALRRPNRPLQFNVAHSQKWAAFAINTDAEIGVDVESLNRPLDWQGIASRFFTGPETEWIRGKGDEPLDLILSRFFRCWTRKEAVLKTLGQGLNFSLLGVDVVTNSGRPVWTKPGDSANDWRVLDFDCANDCFGALASASDKTSVNAWRLPSSF